MKGKRYNTEGRFRLLREAEKVDKSIIEVCKDKGISEQTFHQWKRELGMIPIDQAKRLKELEQENARLRRMPADKIWDGTRKLGQRLS